MYHSDKVPREFAANFAKVATHYGCADEEIAEMKSCAKANLADAKICFAALVEEIDNPLFLAIKFAREALEMDG